MLGCCQHPWRGHVIGRGLDRAVGAFGSTLAAHKPRIYVDDVVSDSLSGEWVIALPNPSQLLATQPARTSVTSPTNNEHTDLQPCSPSPLNKCHIPWMRAARCAHMGKARGSKRAPVKPCGGVFLLSKIRSSVHIWGCSKWVVHGINDTWFVLRRLVIDYCCADIGLPRRRIDT